MTDTSRLEQELTLRNAYSKDLDPRVGGRLNIPGLLLRTDANLRSFVVSYN